MGQKYCKSGQGLQIGAEHTPQALHCDIFLYADDTCLLFQHKDLE